LSLGLDKQDVSDDRFIASDGIVPTNNDPLKDRYAEKQIFTQQSLYMDHILNYNKNLGFEQNLNAFAGYVIQTNQTSTDYGFTTHSSTDYFTTLSSGTINLISTTLQKWNTLSFFGNIDYRFKDKYLVRAGVRLDGSSRFGTEAKSDLKLATVPFALLPYVGLTWRMAAEPFMDFANTVLDELNLRTSFGKTANQNVNDDIKNAVYVPMFLTTFPGLIPGGVANKKITWETTTSFNIGIDLSVLNRLIALSADYFITNSVDVLTMRPVDSYTGSKYVWANDGKIKNNGVEAGITYFGRSGSLNWRLGANIAKYINSVVSTSYGLPIVNGVYGYNSVAAVGQAAGKFYGYKSLGVFSTASEATAANLISDRGIAYKAGDPHYQDVNGDNIIDSRDMQIIGDPNPDLFGSFTASVGYKNLDLEGLFTFSHGNQVMNVLRSKLEAANGYENQSVAALNRWQDDGDVTTIPDTQYSDPQGNIRPSSNWVEDGSYLKLRSLTLSYSLNRKVLFLRNAKIYISGYNLFTLSKYLGWDPDIRTGSNVFSSGYDFGNVPMSHTIMFGISLSL
jgi:TonB-linked SusC/RagA family outer membrane protein